MKVKIQYEVDDQKLIELLDLLEKIETKIDSINEKLGEKEAQALRMSWRSIIKNSQN